MNKQSFYKFLLAVCLLAINVSTGQNFPYLNASTGNPNFFTDKDTNMYFIHGNRLAKLDKNFNAVWVNTYGSLVFRNILLSKTGSMYFIAGPNSYSPNIIGKIEPSGNITWMKSTAGLSLTVAGSSVTSATINCSSFFLDSNNNLLLSGAASGPGNAVLIKMDTAGNFMKGRLFDLSLFGFGSGQPKFSNILNGSAGLINMVALGGSGTGLSAGVSLESFSYSDTGDSVATALTYGFGGCSNCNLDIDFSFFKSKLRSDVFFMYGHIYIQPQSGPYIPYHIYIGKFNSSSRLWSQEYRWTPAPANFEAALDEDERGNIFSVMNTGNSMGGHHSGFVNFDSTGFFNGTWTKYFNNYAAGSNFNFVPDDRVNVIHHNKYFMNVVGLGFPLNPLTTETISPSLTMSCATTVSLSNVATNSAGSFSPLSKPAQYTITSLSATALSPNISAVPGFSISPDFCTIMNIPGNSMEIKFSIYPNPVEGKLKIKAEGIELRVIRIKDLMGKQLLSVQGQSEIDTRTLKPGVYFIEIETSSGIATKKFIRQ